MKPTDTRNATNLYHAPENWNEAAFGPCGDLQVRMEVADVGSAICCVSTWKPSAEDLKQLLRGGVLEIGLYVPNQPVMYASVVDPVDAVLTAERKADDDTLARPITINEEAHGHE